MSSETNARPRAAAITSLSGRQAAVLLCVGVAGMTAVGRLDNAAFVSTNAAVMAPATELATGAPAAGPAVLVFNQRRDSSGAVRRAIREN